MNPYLYATGVDLRDAALQGFGRQPGPIALPTLEQQAAAHKSNEWNLYVLYWAGAMVGGLAGGALARSAAPKNDLWRTAGPLVGSTAGMLLAYGGKEWARKRVEEGFTSTLMAEPVAFEPQLRLQEKLPSFPWEIRRRAPLQPLDQPLGPGAP